MRHLVICRRRLTFTVSVLLMCLSAPNAAAQCEVWMPIGNGVPFSDLHALANYSDQLVAGGGFGTIGSAFQNVARHENGTWVAMGGGLNDQVHCFLNYGNELIAGGFFTASGNGSQPAKRLARWNGSAWETFLGGIDNNAVEAMIEFNGDLIVAGSFSVVAGQGINRVARWDGSNWSSMTGIQGGSVDTLAVYQGTLIAGGTMSLYTGQDGKIIYWTGSTWQPLAGGVSGSFAFNDGGVDALLVYENNLYMGGCFTHAGGVQVNGLARLNGQLWEPVDNGLNHCVNALAVHDGQLIAGGAFEIAGGLSCKRIAKLSQSGWMPLGAGFDSPVFGFHTSTGALLACGAFSNSGGTTLNGVARFGCLNDTCETAILKGAGSHPFTTVGAATDNPNEPECSAEALSFEYDVWYRYLAQCTGTASISLCGASFDTSLAVYSSCPTSSDPAIICNDDYCGSSSQVIFPVVAGSIYRVRIGSPTGATGTGTMVITCTPAPACPADTNLDGAVNVVDLLAVINTWGACQSPCPTDLNSDGTVNVADLLIVINSWGGCP